MKRFAVLLFLTLIVFAVQAEAVQYYISEIYGSCTVADPCRVRAYDYLEAGDCTWWDNASNTGTHRWAIVAVTCTDYSVFNVTGIRALPVFPLDGKVQNISNAARNNIRDVMNEYGIPTTCLNQSEAYRDLIECVARQIVPNWFETAWSWGN